MKRRRFCSLSVGVLALCAGVPVAAAPPPAPERVIVVAGDGSGQFRTVQAAVDSVPAGNRERVVILIRPGTYKERVIVPKEKPFLTIRGEDAARTILTFDNYAAKAGPDGKPFGTTGSASVFVYTDDFTAENLTFENTAGRDIGQAVALRVSGDRCVFTGCRFLGWQDTLYATGTGRQYFRGCYIEGHVDFKFGTAAAVFEECRIHSKGQGYIAAQARTAPDLPTGYVFRDCTLTGDTEPGRVYLGRPWRPYSRVVFIGCRMGAHIRPEGWDNWRNKDNEATAWFAEQDSRGPGAKPDARVSWSRQLKPEEIGAFETDRFFRRGNGDSWDPRRAMLSSRDRGKAIRE